MLPPRIFLIGFRGTGKTTVARLLAEKLGWSWVDADEILEKRLGQSISAIFAEEGEASFRRSETAILADLCDLERHVIATGGGVVLRQDNRAKMKAAGLVVWLTADAQTIWDRLQADPSTPGRRPPLIRQGQEALPEPGQTSLPQGIPPALAEIIHLLQVREPFYADCAHLEVDTVGRSPSEVAAGILDSLGA